MILTTRCPRPGCGAELLTVGRPGPLLELAREQQLQDHAVEHARNGDAGAMTELLGLEPSRAPRGRRARR